VRAEGRQQVIDGAKGGVAYDGNDYIWSWATYDGKTFATAHQTIKIPKGTVYENSYYDPDV